jgi:DNA-binding response OmpR family regulator
VVEDEPLIAMDIAQAFAHTGVEMTTTNTLRHALLLVEYDGLAGAILDHALPDGDCSLLCARLKERDIPFMIYSGFPTVEGACQGALHISKPARGAVLVAAMEGLIRELRIQTDGVSEVPKRHPYGLALNPMRPMECSRKPCSTSERGAS